MKITGIITALNEGNTVGDIVRGAKKLCNEMCQVREEKIWGVLEG